MVKFIQSIFGRKVSNNISRIALRLFFKFRFYTKLKKLRNKNFSIISNNCWGGFVYQALGLKYNSPFVGLFLFHDCYLNLLKNFEQNMLLDIIFINPDTSKYANRLCHLPKWGNYPVGIFKNTDIELHFLHYSSTEEALQKWNTRKKRINMNNLLIKLSETGNDILSDKEFKKTVAMFFLLPFKNKICFTRKPGYKGCIHYPELNNRGEYEKWKYMKHIDIIGYLNSMEDCS